MQGMWSPPILDELLTSYLARQAIAHGSSAHRFAMLLSPSSQVWTRDIDVCATPRLVQDLATASGRSVETMEALTLTEWSRVTARREYAVKGIYHWISSIGVHHRRRLLHGQAFCPECLGENGGFLRKWRLSFWTVCPIHNRFLMDACSRCGEVIQPHRQDFDVRVCWNCSASLTALMAPVAQSTAAQSLLMEALITPHKVFDPCGFRCTGKELLWGIDTLLSAFNASRASGRPSNRAYSRLEMCRVGRRHADMVLVDSLLANGVDGVRARAAQDRVTQRCFRQLMPPWMQSLSSLLPAGRRRRGYCGERREIQAATAAQLTRATGWREMRACLLLKMIGKRK